jgi:magnesium transporter
VATFIAGIHGMNFQHMPERGWQLGYPFAMASMLVVTGGLLFKRRGWL